MAPGIGFLGVQSVSGTTVSEMLVAVTMTTSHIQWWFTIAVLPAPFILKCLPKQPSLI